MSESVHETYTTRPRPDRNGHLRGERSLLLWTFSLLNVVCRPPVFTQTFTVKDAVVAIYNRFTENTIKIKPRTLWQFKTGENNRPIRSYVWRSIDRSWQVIYFCFLSNKTTVPSSRDVFRLFLHPLRVDSTLDRGLFRSSTAIRPQRRLFSRAFSFVLQFSTEHKKHTLNVPV